MSKKSNLTPILVKAKKPRDPNVLAAIRGEINLCTKAFADKTKYTRKSKHKNKDY